MVSQKSKDILTAYNLYRARNNQSTVKYTASNSNQSSTKNEITVARANLVQAQSKVEIQNINEQMNNNQQDIEMVVNDYRSRNPNTDQATMNQDLRTQNPHYGGLIDDQQNLQEQKRTLEDKIINQSYVASSGDLNRDAEKSFSGISTKAPMDSQVQTVPVTYGTTNPDNRVVGTALEGTMADPNFTGSNVDQSTIESIYARQNQDRIDNAVQSNYFWQLRAGQVPIGKALYEPETKNTYFSGDTELSDMANKTQRMELTRMYLEGAGQTMDTPIGNVKTSPTKYTEARNIATKAELLNLPMGNLNTFRPSLTKEGDYTGYVEPTEYRKRITTSSPSEFPTQQGNWNFYETGFGRTYSLTEPTNYYFLGADGKVNQQSDQYKLPKGNFSTASAGTLSFDPETPKSPTMIMGAGNVPSMLGGINMIMFGGSPLKGLAKKADDVFTGKKDGEGVLPFSEFGTEKDADEMQGAPSPELDYSGNRPSEIPDDFMGQILKGSQAEGYNIVKSVDSLATGKDVEYAPTVTGDLIEAFGYDTSKNTYREYTDDFGTNVGIFFESSGTTLAGYSDPKVQEQVGQQLTQAGEKFQKYPIYYMTTGAVEIGTMFVPVGKIGQVTKYTAKGLVAGAKASMPVKAGQVGARMPVMESMKLAMKTDEKKVMESINAILPDGAMQIKKVILKGADKGIYVKQNTVDSGWLNKLTTKVNKLEKVEMLVDSKGNSIMPVMSKARTTEYINLATAKGTGATLVKGLDEAKKAPVSGWTMQVFAETGKDVSNIFGRIETMLTQEAVPRVYAVAQGAEKITDKVGVTIQIPARIADSPEKLSTFTTNLRKSLYTYDKRGTIEGSRNLGELKTGFNIKGKITDYRRFLKEDSISYRYGLTAGRDRLENIGTKLTSGEIEMKNNPMFSKLVRAPTGTGTGYKLRNQLDLFTDKLSGGKMELTDIKYVTTKGKARTDEFQGIEKIGKSTYLANLSFETADKGMGYAVINVANTIDEVSLIPKKFVPDAKNPKLVIPTKEGLFDIAQWGAVYTVSGKTLRSDSINSEMFKLGLKKAIKESETGMVDQNYLKTLGSRVQGSGSQTQQGMKTLFAEAVDKKKINPANDKTSMDEITKILDGNFDDLFKRNPIFATPNSSRPYLLGQGANPLFKSGIDNMPKFFGGQTNDAGKLARLKDKFWYSYAEPEKLTSLSQGTKWSAKTKRNNMMAFANVRDSSISFLGNTKFGKRFASSRFGQKTISTFGKPSESLAVKEVWDEGFTLAQKQRSDLLNQRADLVSQQKKSGGFEFNAKIAKLDKQITKLEEESGFTGADRWIKLDEGKTKTMFVDGKKFTITEPPKFTAMEDTTSEFLKLQTRLEKINQSKVELSKLRTQQGSTGKITDDAINALNLEKANIIGGYNIAIKALQNQKKSLFNLSGNKNITGFKTVQRPTVNAQKMSDLADNPYGMLIAKFNKQAPVPTKPQSSQFISSTKARIAKLEKQAKNYRNDIEPKIKDAKERVKLYEQIVSTGKMTTTRASGKKVVVEINSVQMQQMKGNLRLAKDDLKLWANEIATNKSYQDTLTEITSLKRKVGKMNVSQTKPVRVQASLVDSYKAKEQIANIDTSIAKLIDAQKKDVNVLAINTKLSDLSNLSSASFGKKISALKSKTDDTDYLKDLKKFQAENVKIPKDTNTYRFNEMENLPRPDLPKTPTKGKKKSKSLNDVFSEQNDWMINMVKKYNTKKESESKKNFIDLNNNDPSKPLTTLMANTPPPKDLVKTDAESIIGQFRSDTGRGNLPAGITTGAPMFGIPQAFAQTQQQSTGTKSTPAVQSVPQAISPRIGTNSLFTTPNVKTDQGTTSIFGSFKIQPPVTQPVQKTGKIITPFTGQKQSPIVQSDIMQQTDQISTQIGATAQALDQQFRLDNIQVFDRSSILAPPTGSTSTKVVPPKRVPAIIPTPKFPVFASPPLDLFNRAQRKPVRKKKKKKEKGEATAWAVPDVWFDAKGYYFSGGNAYVKGAKAKSAPKRKRVKKSKR